MIKTNQAIIKRRDFILKRVVGITFIEIIIIFGLLHPTEIKGKGSCKYANTTINIRAKPNINSKIIGKIYWNDRVKIHKAENKKWAVINYKGKKRYLCKRYLQNRKHKYKSYSSPSSKTFKSFEDSKCITNNKNIPQGKLKSEYHLDHHSGVWMVGNRYCIAVGSYYTKEIGVKIDLVLSSAMGRKHILKCIAADSKSDNDTTNNHRVHKKDGSVVEFIVKTKYLPTKAKTMGDISYCGQKFKGKIKEIRVYK